MAQHGARRIVVPQPTRLRRLEETAFGWMDARLHRDGWLRLLPPEPLGLYTFLCLVADRRGVSWYSRARMGQELRLTDEQAWRGLDYLEDLELVAYEPFGPHTADGFHQVLALPKDGPGRC